MTDCLLPQGKFSEAREVLKAAARRNGVKLSQHLLNPEPAKDGESAAVEERWGNFLLLQTFESLPTLNILRCSVMDCFHPSALPVTLSLFLIWPVITLVYYGLTFRCLEAAKKG